MKKINQRLLQVAVAVLVSLLISVITGQYNNGWPGVMLSALITVGAMLGMRYLMDRKDADYTKRINAPSPPDLAVSLNGISLGTLSDSHYAAMQQDAFRDARTTLLQLCNLGRMALTALRTVISTVSILVLWGLVWAAFFAPDLSADIVRAFQTTDAAAIARALQAYLQLCVTLVLMTMLVMPVFGFRHGFKNCYSDAVHQMLRHHFNTPVEGVFRLTAKPTDPLQEQQAMPIQTRQND